ncbi:hypothetical protein L210DRAFT_3504500 [Boletus edulis BED1]|uniref:Uncharacterized protein n=1 Tax=Boletus edulis BED1 TaxID=1328754 RepID=A0AAD4BT24_BOLED|nr:hypothetical protein L210DRAFT_3504500 [Boletus edulis BED1]
MLMLMLMLNYSDEVEVGCYIFECRRTAVKVGLVKGAHVTTRPMTTLAFRALGLPLGLDHSYFYEKSCGVRGLIDPGPGLPRFGRKRSGPIGDGMGSNTGSAAAHLSTAGDGTGLKAGQLGNETARRFGRCCGLSGYRLAVARNGERSTRASWSDGIEERADQQRREWVASQGDIYLIHRAYEHHNSMIEEKKYAPSNSRPPFFRWFTSRIRLARGLVREGGGPHLLVNVVVAGMCMLVPNVGYCSPPTCKIGSTSWEASCVSAIGSGGSRINWSVMVECPGIEHSVRTKLEEHSGEWTRLARIYRQFVQKLVYAGCQTFGTSTMSERLHHHPECSEGTKTDGSRLHVASGPDSGAKYIPGTISPKNNLAARYLYHHSLGVSRHSRPTGDESPPPAIIRYAYGTQIQVIRLKYYTDVAMVKLGDVPPTRQGLTTVLHCSGQ